jgi:hypothetical protein
MASGADGFWESRWTMAAFGLAFLWFGYYIYGELAAMEATGGSMRINALFALIYRLIGKWGVCLVFVAISGLFFWGAIAPRKPKE